MPSEETSPFSSNGAVTEIVLPVLPASRMATKNFLTETQKARMERVYEATKRLLGEFGTEGVTLRDIAKAGQTSEGTLYNRFGSRSGLIDAVLLDTFEQNVRAFAKRQNSGTPVQRLLLGGAAMVDSILESPGFSRALLGTYFKIGGERTIQRYMDDVVTNTWFPILEEMQRHQALRPWVSLSLLCCDLRDRQFSMAGKWAQEAIPDKELQTHLDFALLTSLFGASQGEQEQEIEERLVKLTTRLGKSLRSRQSS